MEPVPRHGGGGQVRPGRGLLDDGRAMVAGSADRCSSQQWDIIAGAGRRLTGPRIFVDTSATGL